MSDTISNKPYDDVFKSALVHCRQFVVPFHFFVYEKDLKDYNSGKKDMNRLLAEFDYWMDRSPGSKSNETELVGTNGTISTFNHSVSDCTITVRPALWLSVKN